MKNSWVNLLKFTLTTGICSIFSVHSAYYDTLPKGVRLFAMKQVQTSNINSSFNKGNVESPYALNQTINFRSLKDINSFTKEAYKSLNDISPEAAKELTMGTYEADATAKVNVTGFGGAVGITNTITLYGSIPYYNAKVDMAFNRTAGNNYQKVSNMVSQGNQTDFSQAFQDLTKHLPDADGPLLQSIVTNTYGYQPIGSWQGTGYGDAEFGTMLRLTDYSDRGTALTLGAVAPTGKVEDPDVLQDISFGDGQWDAFLELGGGILANNYLFINSWVRGTYQFASTRTLRAPHDKDFTLSSDKTDFRIKLGNKVDYTFSPTFTLTDWLAFKSEYIYSYQGAAKYESKYKDADAILGANTESYSQNIRLAASISSTKLFLKKEFFLPASIEMSAQKMIDGQNTPKYSRYDIEMRFYF